MRTKTGNKTIVVSEHIHNLLIEDRNHFEKTIGGGKWSINDTINEYIKIIHMKE